MQKVRLKYSYLVFLSAYFHHLYLSLDRAQWTSWEAFREYYNKDFIHPQIVARWLVAESGLPPRKDVHPAIFEAPKPRIYLYSWFLATFGGRSILSFAEIQYTFQLLTDLTEALNMDDEHLEISFIRDFSKRAINVNSSLLAKLLPKDRKRVQKIEHYLQSEHIKTLPISEFIIDLKFQ